MNLQSIQKRLQELSAEALTLSNDLEFLIQGEVARPTVEIVQLNAVQVRIFKDVREGDILQFSEPFHHINDSSKLPAGNYKVFQVEDEDYDGVWSIMLEVDGERNTTWINFNSISAKSVVNRLRAV